MKTLKKILVFAIPALLIIISGIFLLTHKSGSNEIIITGIIESEEVDAASKLPGRLDSVFVKEGDYVKKGDLLALLESKEMDAKVLQVKSAVDAAKSRYDMAMHGARPEEKAALQNLYQQAKHQYELMEKTYKRFSNLYNDSLISMQERDQVEFQYKAAFEQMNAAKSKLEMAVNGARPEEIDGAAALYHQAENAYNEVIAYHSELHILSPISGEVTKKLVDQGEVISSGFPLFTLTNTDSKWIVIQIKEELLSNFPMGKIVEGKVPGLNNGIHKFKVTYISAVGDFANWKPTNQKDGYDVKTFEIHLTPVDQVEGLRTGMSVNITL